MGNMSYMFPPFVGTEKVGTMPQAVAKLVAIVRNPCASEEVKSDARLQLRYLGIKGNKSAKRTRPQMSEEDRRRRKAAERERQREKRSIERLQDADEKRRAAEMAQAIQEWEDFLEQHPDD